MISVAASAEPLEPADPSDAVAGDATASAETDAPPASGSAADATGSTLAPRRRASPPPPIGTRFPEPLEGERLRLGYQFKRSKYQGLLNGDRDARPGFVRNRFIPYTETPRRLDLTAHIIELAWAPHPRTTLVVQVPFLVRDLETLEESGTRRHDQTDGVGDIAFALVVPFIRKGNESSHVHIGFDAPSGDIRQKDQDGRQLPYDLQLGNGTVDFEWGWTYRGEMDWLSWGGQALGRHPLEENDRNYREGSRFEASLWGGVRLVDGLSASLRVQWQKQNNIRGADDAFSGVVVDGDVSFPDIRSPAENSKARGGTRFLIGPGLAYDLPGALRGHRIALEVAVPVHQDLHGPQLERDWELTTGWQWAF